MFIRDQQLQLKPKYVYTEAVTEMLLADELSCLVGCGKDKSCPAIANARLTVRPHTPCPGSADPPRRTRIVVQLTVRINSS